MYSALHPKPFAVREDCSFWQKRIKFTTDIFKFQDLQEAKTRMYLDCEINTFYMNYSL